MGLVTLATLDWRKEEIELRERTLCHKIAHETSCVLQNSGPCRLAETADLHRAVIWNACEDLALVIWNAHLRGCPSWATTVEETFARQARWARGLVQPSMYPQV